MALMPCGIAQAHCSITLNTKLITGSWV